MKAENLCAVFGLGGLGLEHFPVLLQVRLPRLPLK